MRFNRLDLNLLIALDVLLAERSITRAAARLHLSQSSTSGIMSRLREYFEDELLMQVGRIMVLTPLAESLVEPVRDILLRVKSTIEMRPRFEPATSDRHFRIIGSDYISTVLLSEVSRRLHLIAPMITLEVMGPGTESDALIDRGDVDLLILPEKYLATNHPHEKLFMDDHSCVVWTENRLVRDAVSLDQFKSMGHVSTAFGSQRRVPSFEEWFLSESGIVRRIEAVTDSFCSVPQYVVGTNRIATMHSRLARFYSSYFPLRVLTPPVHIPPIVECMQWNRLFDKDGAHIWLRQLISGIAQGHCHK